MDVTRTNTSGLSRLPEADIQEKGEVQDDSRSIGRIVQQKQAESSLKE